MESPGQRQADNQGNESVASGQATPPTSGQVGAAGHQNAELDVARAFAGAASSLESELGRDLERLRTAAMVSDAAIAWVDQYPDEASALNALGGRKIGEIDSKIAASTPGPEGVQLDWMVPSWPSLEPIGAGHPPAKEDPRLQLQSTIQLPQSTGS